MIIRTNNDYLVAGTRLDSFYLRKNKKTYELVGNGVTGDVLLGTWLTEGVAKMAYLDILDTFANAAAGYPQGHLDFKVRYPKDATEYSEERLADKEDVTVHKMPTIPLKEEGEPTEGK